MARLLLFLAALVLAGCGGTNYVFQAPTPEAAVSFTVLSDSLAPDPEVAAMVAPYRENLEAQVSEVVGRAEVEIQKGRPEGPLGTFAAEAMLSVVQGLTDRPVHLALTNNGGLRRPLGPGAITVGQMFELMPFENMMIVLDFSAAQVDSLAQQLARSGGDPIAGFSFLITPDERAVNVRVADEPLDSARTYRLVTSDYLANGGGPYSVLWGDVPREELAYLLRDAFTDHLRAIGIMENRVDGLIRVQQ
ncbi:MAG: 5'-nucleotidase C-terminal domain-containing protein [Rhodothermales bacterium]|nr:5'-nucleotidase C-terminal domain-containing protein [Rhodothermales bacterium]MBO6781188.1 5'-nucleotidase C-terminal domain-containing protein [Rhodothermales bacterium]